VPVQCVNFTFYHLLLVYLQIN